MLAGALVWPSPCNWWPTRSLKVALKLQMLVDYHSGFIFHVSKQFQVLGYYSGGGNHHGGLLAGALVWPRHWSCLALSSLSKVNM